MKNYSRFGLALFVVAFGVAGLQMLVAVSGTKDAFWASTHWADIASSLIAVGLIAALYTFFRHPVAASVPQPGEYRDPAIVRFFMTNRGSSPFWATLRLWMAPTLFAAGWHKLQLPAWTDGGSALGKFWKTAIDGSKAVPPKIGYPWYGDVLQWMYTNHFYSWFAWVVIFGEIALGVALLLGAFTGIAGGMTAFMTWNYGMAGSASINPLFMIIGVLIFIAGRTAGHYGIDGELLPALGTPWQPGRIFTARPHRPLPTS